MSALTFTHDPPREVNGFTVTVERRDDTSPWRALARLLDRVCGIAVVADDGFQVVAPDVEDELCCSVGPVARDAARKALREALAAWVERQESELDRC